MSFGVASWCLDRIVSGRFATGRTLVIQALYRRMTTPRGRLIGGPEEAAYGLDVCEYIGALGDDVAVNALPALLRGEFLKDDRVRDVDVSVVGETNSDGTLDLMITVDGTLHASGETFQFTVSVNEVSAKFLGGTL